MPGIKKSTAAKKLAGTYQACRDKKNVPVSSEKLGPAPVHMTDAEKSIWEEMSSKLPERTATAADSLAFEVMVRLMTRFRDEELTGTELTLLMRTLGKFGLTPQDRGNVEPAPKPKGPSKWK